jgi:hypothetical protein
MILQNFNCCMYMHARTCTHTHTQSQMLHHNINSMNPKSKTSNMFPAIIAKINYMLRIEHKIIQDKYHNV